MNVVDDGLALKQVDAMSRRDLVKFLMCGTYQLVAWK